MKLSTWMLLLRGWVWNLRGWGFWFLSVTIIGPIIHFKAKRERLDPSKALIRHDEENSMLLLDSLKPCRSTHSHPIQRSSLSRCWSYSSIGSLHFHKYFSNLLRCLGGTVVAAPLPLSLPQVLRKGVPLRASTLISFDACRWLAKGIPVVMKPFTVKWSSGTWLISATY